MSSFSIRALKKQDFPFELVHLLNGGEALAFIRRQGAYADAAIPNLILLDLNLSKYTGEDILREIRNAPHLAGVPVCVWSSSRSRRDESQLREPGSLPVHPQAFRPGSIHGNRQNHQGSAGRRHDPLTAVQRSVPSPCLRDWPTECCSFFFQGKVMVVSGKEDRQ